MPNSALRLAYQQATISLTADVTAPASEIAPIGSLLVGQVEGRPIAGIAVLVPAQLDALTRLMLEDLPTLVRQLVEHALERGAAPGDVLAQIARKLRNSVHVSGIAEPANVQVDELAQLGGVVTELLYRGLRSGELGARLPMSLVWQPLAT